MLSYALKSFRRQFTRYTHLVIVLACALVLPLCLHVVSESVKEGEIQ